jgi:hypothetical protein
MANFVRIRLKRLYFLAFGARQEINLASLRNKKRHNETQGNEHRYISVVLSLDE